MQTNADFLGTGWSFPPAFDKQSGEVVLTSGMEDINKSLEVILTTNLGERLMLPDFGCRLQEAIFDSMTTSTLTYMQSVIETALIYYEPRIDVKEVKLDFVANEGVLRIHIYYQIRGTNSRFNFVYPYYLNEANNVI